MERKSTIVEAKVVSSPMSSSATRAASTTAFAGVEPDPRWPSLSRWSAPISSPLMTPSATTVVGGATITVVASSPAPTTQPLRISENLGQTPLEIDVSGLVSNLISDKSSSSLPEVVIVTTSGDSLEARNESNLPSPPLVQEKDNISASPSNIVPILQGAWAQHSKLISSGSSSTELWPSLSESQKRQGKEIEAHLRKPFITATQQEPSDSKEDDLRFPWAARMNPSCRNLYRATEPEYMDDGTPKVTIPSHVLRQGVENQKEYVLGQFYRCSPPPGGLIHAVVNKIWGRKCGIFVRNLGDSKYLFHIPDASTRLWILQRGLWHIDDCLMFVAPWTPSASLALPDISTVPVWLTLKNIPYLCYSIPGISHIASGLGAPMATHKPRLDPTHMGEAKILVEVELSKAFPSRIAVDDKQGSISMVEVEYAWIPTKCGKCGQLGHKVSRCLQKLPTHQEKAKRVVVEEVGSQVEMVVSDITVVVPLDLVSESAPILDDHVATGQKIVADASATQILDPSISTIVEEKIGASSSTQKVKDIVSTIGNDVIIKTPRVKSVEFITEASAEVVLGSNPFFALGSSDMEEDTNDSEEETDMLDLLTPSGQRILRDRPVKPSTKAKEMETSSKAGGRRGRGRGKRGGRG